MAKFKSTIFSEIRGSINGLTFSRVKGTAIVRNRTVPVQPNTTSQSVVRSWFQEAANTFSDLNAAAVDAWDNAISTSSFQVQNGIGDSYTPSAKQLVTSMKMNMLSGGSTNNPDVSKFLANPITPDVILGDPADIAVLIGPPVSLGQIEVDVTTTDLANNVYQVKATGPLNPSITNYKKYLRLLPGTFSPAGPQQIQTEYLTVFPGYAWDELAGQRIGLAYRMVNLDTGLASAWIYAELATIPVAA